MDRRDTLKSLLITSFAGGLVLNACDDKAPATKAEVITSGSGYGRTPEEAQRDQRLKSQEFFTQHELTTIAVLCDIILPTFEDRGSASDADVAEFVAFIVKDMPGHQTPLRGGLMWLDHLCNKEFNSDFESCSPDQQIAIVERIAYPENFQPGMEPGVSFFSRMRDLTLTGYYTTRMGIEDLGYKGNTPNVWDGVPDDVLKDHGLEYPAEWLPKFVDQSKRDVKAEWDEDGNLIT